MRTFQDRRFEVILLCALNLVVLAVHAASDPARESEWQRMDDSEVDFSNLSVNDPNHGPEHENNQHWPSTSHVTWNPPPVAGLLQRANRRRLESANARDNEVALDINTRLSAQHSASTTPVRLSDGRRAQITQRLHRNRELLSNYPPEFLERAATILGPAPVEISGEKVVQFIRRWREYHNRLNDFYMDQIIAGLDQTVRSERTEPSSRHILGDLTKTFHCIEGEGRAKEIQKELSGAELSGAGTEPEEIDVHEKACSICLDEYVSQTCEIFKLQCNHFFHAHCISGWFNEHADTCPLCRETSC